MGIQATISKLKSKIRGGSGQDRDYIPVEDLEQNKKWTAKYENKTIGTSSYNAPTIRERISGVKAGFKQKIAERKLLNKEKAAEQAIKETEEIKTLQRKTKLAKAKNAYNKISSIQPPRPQFRGVFASGFSPGGQTGFNVQERPKTKKKGPGGPPRNVFGGIGPF